MSDWKQRAEVLGDVVYFNYLSYQIQKNMNSVFVWDLDKTYLDTRWGSIRDLLKTLSEKAFQKKNVPGTSSLVRALLKSWDTHSEQKVFPIYFITASPPQLEKRIIEKLELDGIYPIGMFFKDNLKNLRPKRLWQLTHQIGYKLQALLQLRTKLPEQNKQILWGDDSEADAIIYCLYSDICARRISDKELLHTLRGLRVIGPQVEMILKLRNAVAENDPVEKIYINLAVDTDPEYYLKFGRRVVPTHNTFQASLDLFQDGRVEIDQVVQIGKNMVSEYGFSPEELEKSFDEFLRRQILTQENFSILLPALQRAQLILPSYIPSLVLYETSRISPATAAAEISNEPWIQERIDYLNDYR